LGKKNFMFDFALQSNLHVAIIMDGNGRWATRCGLTRLAGHRAGAEALRGVVEAAPGYGIAVLTVYAFSSDNWKRPQPEVDALMALLAWYLANETPHCAANSIRMSVIGRRDRLPEPVRAAISAAEQQTLHGAALHLRLAIDYSARDAILDASERSAGRHLTREGFEQLLGGTQAVDILIRTGGEQRLSDFLLWECAYAELIFSNRMWPEFTPLDLQRAVQQFSNRERRYGALPQAPVTTRDHWLR
jgi:undecaprenyl diphosphate synthase